MTAGAIFNRTKFPQAFITCEISSVLEKEKQVPGRDILYFRKGAVKIYFFCDMELRKWVTDISRQPCVSAECSVSLTIRPFRMKPIDYPKGRAPVI